MSNKIAGPFDAYWAPYSASLTSDATVTLGAIGPEGIEQIKTRTRTPITGDALGPETEIDAVTHGGNCELRFILEDIKLDKVKQFLNPLSQVGVLSSGMTSESGGTFSGGPEWLGVPGDLESNYIGKLELIPRDNTPADALNVNGVTNTSGRQYYGIVIDDIREILASGTPNFIPVRFRCYPFQNANNEWVWWDWIAAKTS